MILMIEILLKRFFVKDVTFNVDCKFSIIQNYREVKFLGMIVREIFDSVN